VAAGGGVNMSAWWMITLLVGFVVAVINLFQAVIWNWLGGFMGCFIATAFDLVYSFVWAIFLMVTRWTHGGRVIAGDLCPEG